MPLTTMGNRFRTQNSLGNRDIIIFPPEFRACCEMRIWISPSVLRKFDEDGDYFN